MKNIHILPTDKPSRLYYTISMTDFVLEQYKIWCDDNNPDCRSTERYISRTKNYATFLKQPLKLGMFVPCDENDDVLEEPNDYKYYIHDDETGAYDGPHEKDCIKYMQAKERVLFEGFYMDFDEGYICPFLENYPVGFFNLSYWCLSDRFKTIEDLVKYNLKLTKNPLD